MKEHPILFSTLMVSLILSNHKTQTRRPLSMASCFVDGRSPTREQWPHLQFDVPEVFVDGSSSPAGNPGPYLHVPHDDGDTRHRVYPRIEVGDRLWVRETWGMRGGAPAYLATDEAWGMRGPRPDSGKWTPAIHMPRTVARLVLEVTGVRAERVQDISESDAKAEGMRTIDMPEEWMAVRPRFGGRDAGGLEESISFDKRPSQALIDELGLTEVSHHPARSVTSAREIFRSLWESIYKSWDANPWVWAVSFKRIDAKAKARAA